MLRKIWKISIKIINKTLKLKYKLAILSKLQIMKYKKFHIFGKFEL